jgi:hypothetical protein
LADGFREGGLGVGNRARALPVKVKLKISTRRAFQVRVALSVDKSMASHSNSIRAHRPLRRAR